MTVCQLVIHVSVKFHLTQLYEKIFQLFGLFRRRAFEKKIFNSSVGVYFIFFLIQPIKRKVVNRIVGDLYKTFIGCKRGCEDRTGGFKIRHGPHFFVTNFEILVHTFQFLEAKNRVYPRKFEIF